MLSLQKSMIKIYFSRTSYLPYGILAASLILLPQVLRGQQQQQFHSGKITQSFTEPIERSVTASAEPGIISISHVKEGDRVQVGDLLAVLNHNVLLDSLAIAEATSKMTARRDAAKTQLELLKSQLDTVGSLVNGGHASKVEVENKHAEHNSAVAEFREAEDELSLARLEVQRIKTQIKTRKILSPIDGFVTEIHKQLGEHVSTNEPQYATIVRVDELKVRFYLDSDTIKNSHLGQQVSILIGTERTEKPALVTYVSPIMDADSGLGRLDVKINNTDLKIQSGTICFWPDGSRITTANSSRKSYRK